MAQFIPRRDETLEADKHQKWLQDEVLPLKKEVQALRAIVDKLAKANATSGKQVAVINARDNGTSTETAGVPLPTLKGGVLRGKGSTFGPFWSYDWQGLVPKYFVYLDPTGSTYATSGMSLTTNYINDQSMAQALLPPVQFDDDGMTMLPIDFGGNGDNPADIYSGRAQVPISLSVQVYPSFDGEEFTIYLPTHANSYGVTAPWYSFSLSNQTEFSATVNILDTNLFYQNGAAVNGDVDVWTLAPSYLAGWFVQNVVGWGATAFPARYLGAGSVPTWSDPYYESTL